MSRNKIMTVQLGFAYLFMFGLSAVSGSLVGFALFVILYMFLIWYCKP